MSTSNPANSTASSSASAMVAIPASTVILIRDCEFPGVGIEVLMLKRTGGGSFGGYWVFPGGRVDPEDADELATAVREAKEESGIDLDSASFVRLSHWQPPIMEVKRFSTWFFLARAPHLHDVEIDDGEIVDHAWVSPTEMLARRDAGEIELAPPTFVSLYILSAHSNVESALTEVRAAEPTQFLTQLVRLDDERGKRGFTIWQGDVAYDKPSMIDEAGGRHRVEITTSPWVYVRDF